jgi:predicted dienelactone hydrolase
MTSCTPDARPDAYPVGFRQIALKFGRSPLPVGLWYPTHEPERLRFFGPFSMRVALGAAPCQGNGRLIVISHGSKGNHLGHRGAAHELAAAGYIVAAPLHPHDNYLDDSQSGTPGLWIDRPAHLRIVTDAVTTDPVFGPLLVSGACGVMGFSLGGYSALCLLGGRASVQALFDHRRRHPDDLLPVAPGDAGPLTDDLEVALATHPDAFPQERDERFKAGVLLAPMCALFSDAGLRTIETPVSLYCAERDDVLREPYHSHRLAELLPQLKHFECVPAAGHFSFLTALPGALHDELPELAFDAPDFDRDAFHAQLHRKVVAFFDDVLGQVQP